MPGAPSEAGGPRERSALTEKRTEKKKEKETVERLNDELDTLISLHGRDEEHARHAAVLDALGDARPRSSPRPFLCDAALTPTLTRVCDVVHRAIERATELWFAGGALADVVPVPEHLRAIVHARHGYEGFNVFCRFDVHVSRDGNDVRVLELNCADPSAIAWHDWMVRATEATRAWRTFAARHGARFPSLVPLHWSLLRERHHDAADVTFVIADDSTVRFDFTAFAHLYRELGIRALVTDPRRFDARRGALVVRDTLDEIVLPTECPERRAVREAIRDASVVVVNPTSSVLADQKAMLEVLSDPEWQTLFDRQDQEVLAKVIPWTRVLRERKTTYDRTRIDLVPWVMDRKDALVLKPSEGYGGFGVTVGRSVSIATWRERVEAALEAAHPFVVQDYVAPPVIAIARDADPMPFNVSLWSFAGRFAGAIMRASPHAVVNVHQGGVLVPVAFV
jgi:hypothetical protein